MVLFLVLGRGVAPLVVTVVVLVVQPPGSGGEALGGHHVEGSSWGEGEEDVALGGEVGVRVCGGASVEDSGSAVGTATVGYC